jgi:hypothetical protein
MIGKLYTVKPGTSPIGARFDGFGIEPETGVYTYTDDSTGRMIQQDRIANVYGIVGNAAQQIGSVVRRQQVTEVIDPVSQARTGFNKVGESRMFATLLSYGTKGHKLSHYQPMNESGQLELSDQAGGLKADLLDAVETWAIDTGALDAQSSVRAAASGAGRPAASFGKVQSKP